MKQNTAITIYFWRLYTYQQVIIRSHQIVSFHTNQHGNDEVTLKNLLINNMLIREIVTIK